MGGGIEGIGGWNNRASDIFDQGLAKFDVFIDKFAPRALTKPEASKTIKNLAGLGKAVIGAVVAVGIMSLSIISAIATFTFFPFFVAAAFTVAGSACFYGMMADSKESIKLGLCAGAMIALGPIAIAGTGVAAGGIALALTIKSIENEFVQR